MNGLGVLRYGFLVIGCLVLAITTTWSMHIADFVRHAIRADAVVTGNVYRRDSNSRSSGGTYHPRFTFTTPDGQTVTAVSNVGSYPPSFREGDHTLVLYDPKDARSAKINSIGELWIGPIVVGVLGVVCTGIGIILWFAMRQNRVVPEKLKSQGQQIFATITGIERLGIEINGRYPYRILAQWQDPASSKVYVFRSSQLGYDPLQWATPGKSVSVLIDPGRPTRYFMDTSFLPPAGN